MPVIDTLVKATAAQILLEHSGCVALISDALLLMCNGIVEKAVTQVIKCHNAQVRVLNVDADGEDCNPLYKCESCVNDIIFIGFRHAADPFLLRILLHLSM